MPLAAFFGISTAIKVAYTPAIRKELARNATLYPEDLTNDTWRAHADKLKDLEIIFSTWGMPKMDKEFLEAFPKLRAVYYAAGTVKGFALPEAYARGITVCSAASANAVPVAEYTLATVLLSLKKFWLYAAETRETCKWRRDKSEVTGTYHATVGLVSLGAVGRAVAQMLGRFDLDLVGYDPFTSKEQADELNLELMSLEDLFRRSDVVSIHTPWLKETENMINESLFRLMKPGATFINTSRGAIVNETDLIKVFSERPDLTAILDVTWPEPPPVDSPLYKLKNVIVTPHIAGSMGNEVTRMGRWMADEYTRFLEKKPYIYQVTQEMLARMA